MSISNGSPLQATTPRLDNVQALTNLATGQGVGKYDPSNSGQIGIDGKSYLDQNTQAFYRRKHKILRKLIEVIPNQMTFRWGRLTLGGDDGDPKVIDEVAQWGEDLVTRTVYNRYIGLPAAFNAAQIEANETGNAALIILADDGQADDQPLKLTNIKDIHGLYLVNRWAIKPDTQGITFSGKEAGITHYSLTQQRVINQIRLVASNGKPLAMGNEKIHRSRVLWFRGEELSDYSLQQNSGCDDSVLEGVIQAYKEYNAGLRGAGRMLVDFDFFVHQIEGYFDKMMGDGSKEYGIKMQERLEANSLMRSAYRGMTIDKDKEVIDTVSRSVAGYSDLLEQVLSNFLSNTDLQPSELLQKYPAGLANTGKTEQQNCNDRTRLYQSKKFNSNIRDFLRIIFNWKGGPTKGVEPERWSWEWEELYPTTPLEQSELELNWAQIDANRIQSGVYSPDDAAKSHYSTPEFNPHITIDFKERERLKKEREQQAIAAGQQQDPNADPNADPLAGLTFDAADPLIAPKQVMDAAKKGLQIRRQLDSGAVPARVALLARKLDAGEHLSRMDLQAIQFYHQRHQKPPSELGLNLDTAMYLLHGGVVGKLWADRALTPARTDSVRLDDDTPIKRTLDWKGFKIGLQYQPFDLRHEKLLPCGYGEIIGTTAADGMPLDCYVGAELDSDRVFVVSQLKADTGEFDEHKLFIGFTDDAPAIKDLFVSLMGQERFGGIREIQPQDVLELTENEREDGIRMDKPCGAGFIAKEKQCQKGIRKYSNYKERKIDGLTEVLNGHDLTYIDRNLEKKGSYGTAGIQYHLATLPEFSIPTGADAKAIQEAARRSGKVVELSFYPYLKEPSSNFLGKDASVKAGMDVIKDQLSKEDKKALAFAARNIGKRVLAQQSPGTLLVNRPTGGGSGARARIYEKMGFSRIEGKQVYQFAVVGDNGTLNPLSAYKTKKDSNMDSVEDDLALWYEAIFEEPLEDDERDDGIPPEAQAYIDAEERALAADGDVLDADEFDPAVDEVDASEAVDDWEQDAGQFKFALEAE
jgi:phage-related protein (TIGR01555 family)